MRRYLDLASVAAYAQCYQGYYRQGYSEGHVGKANISFPEGMLEAVDQRSESSGVTRSAFIQEAITRYLADLDRDLARVVRVDRIEQAIIGMHEIGERLPGGSDGVALLRQLRNATPVWLERRAGGDE